MRKAPFSGISILDPGESLTTDGGAFVARDRETTDLLLRIGARSHRHDAHEALADPTIAPVVTSSPTGGTLPADVTLSVCYTLVDEQGGETLPSPVASVNTGPGVEPPTDVPTAVVSYDGGELLAGDYAYVVTLIDGLGGETPPNDAVSVYREPGSASGQITIGGLSAIVAASPRATGWRLYRSTRGGGFDYLTTGSLDSFTDDGSVCCDCGISPPTENTTGGTSEVTIAVGSGAVGSAATGWRLYVTPDGDFTTPSLLGATRAPGTASASVVISALALSSGQPPDVSTAVPGAQKIDPDTDMLDFPWKRPVNSAANLPTTGNDPGDVRVIRDSLSLAIWDADGNQWLEASGGSGVVDPGGGGTFSWRGEWAADEAYAQDDLVYFDGSTFRGLAEIPAGGAAPPPDGDASWGLVAKRGADGQDGEDGAPGSGGTGGSAAAPRQFPLIGINGNFQDPELYADEQELGVQAVRIEVTGSGNLLDPGGLANTLPDAVEVLHAAGIKVLLLLNRYDIAWDDPWWETTAVEVAPFCDLGVIEAGNEPYIDGIGGRATELHRDAVGYGAMLERVADALVAAGSPVKVLAAAGGTGTGGLDYDTTGAGDWSGAWNGGGWIGDIQRAHPELEAKLGGWVLHPYDITDPDTVSGPRSQVINAQRFTDHPIWITEGGQKADPTDVDAEAGKAASIDVYVDEFLLDPEQNVAAFFFYNEKDYTVFDPGGDNGFALIHQDGTRAPAWDAYQAAAARVAAAQLQPEPEPATVVGGWVFRDPFQQALPQHYVEDPAGAFWLDEDNVLKIVSGDATEKRITRRDAVLSDVRATIKLTAGTAPDAGLMMRKLDDDNYLMALMFVGAGTTTIACYKRDGGTYTNLGSQAAPSLTAGEDYWLLGRAIGDRITVELWDVDPRIGLEDNVDPMSAISRVLAGGDATKFGTGVTGAVGLRTQPNADDTTYDDLTAWDLSSPIAVGGPQGPKGDPGNPGLDGKSFRFRGAFDGGSTYAAYDVVTFAGGSYVATVAVAPSEALPNINASWQVIALAGIKGDTGDKGDPGDPGGSGGVGGHTILDDALAALPDEPNLRFPGAQVTDDPSTNSTVIDISGPVSDQIADQAPGVGDTEWAPLQLASGFTDASGGGAGYVPAGKVDAAGLVHLRGRLTTTLTTRDTAAALSDMLKPAAPVRVPHAYDDDTVGTALIGADGSLSVKGKNGAFFLDGISYPSGIGEAGLSPADYTVDAAAVIDPSDPLRAYISGSKLLIVGSFTVPANSAPDYPITGHLRLRGEGDDGPWENQIALSATYRVVAGPLTGQTGSAGLHFYTGANWTGSTNGGPDDGAKVFVDPWAMADDWSSFAPPVATIDNTVHITVHCEITRVLA